MDYFQRSELFGHQVMETERRKVRSQFAWEQLFVEQCFNLLKTQGVSGIVSRPWLEGDRAEALKSFLRENTNSSELVWDEEITVVTCTKK